MSTAPMPMSVEVTVLQPQGRLDASSAPGLDRQLQSLLDPGTPHVVVDLAQVTYVSSSALRVLLVGLKRARSLGGDLRLSALRANVLNVFKITGFVTLFQIYETLEEAVRSYTEEAKSGQEKCAGDRLPGQNRQRSLSSERLGSPSSLGHAAV